MMRHWESFVGVSFLPRVDPTKTAEDLGYNIKQATLYLSCWMTLAQIKKFSTKKVIFRDLVN